MLYSDDNYDLDYVVYDHFINYIDLFGFFDNDYHQHAEHDKHDKLSDYHIDVIHYYSTRSVRYERK